MSVLSSLRRLVNGGTNTDATAEEEDERDPTHVCQSCGAELTLRQPEIAPETCPECGGVKIEAV